MRMSSDNDLGYVMGNPTSMYKVVMFQFDVWKMKKYHLKRRIKMAQPLSQRE